MPQVAVKDIENKDAGTLSLPEELFGLTGSEALMHQAVVAYLANQRQGTHATKNRALITGGGRKPYRQKGTGRARAGSVRSPLWNGGATTFGPQPRDYRMAMPRKARRKALYAALSSRLAEGSVLVVEGIPMEKPRTKRMLEILKTLDLTAGSLLLVLRDLDAAVALSARNIPWVTLMLAGDLHAYDVLSHDRLLLTREALEALEQKGAEAEEEG
ncbi:MAG: 50S ribosomal protein L4 [Nitrospirota bacterium]|jgi:large subunit ribosomal protein L4